MLNLRPKWVVHKVISWFKAFIFDINSIFSKINIFKAWMIAQTYIDTLSLHPRPKSSNSINNETKQAKYKLKTSIHLVYIYDSMTFAPYTIYIKMDHRTGETKSGRPRGGSTLGRGGFWRIFWFFKFSNFQIDQNAAGPHTGRRGVPHFDRCENLPPPPPKCLYM